MSKKIMVVKVSPKILCQLLSEGTVISRDEGEEYQTRIQCGLPQGSELIAARFEYPFGRNIEFAFSHESFPDSDGGGVLPELQVICKTEPKNICQPVIVEGGE